MRARAPPSGSNQGNLLAFLYVLALSHEHLGHVSVFGVEAVRVINLHQVAECPGPSRKADDAILSSNDGGARARSYVDSLVHPSPSSSEERRDPSVDDRPSKLGLRHNLAGQIVRGVAGRYKRLLRIRSLVLGRTSSCNGDLQLLPGFYPVRRKGICLLDLRNSGPELFRDGGERVSGSDYVLFPCRLRDLALPRLSGLTCRSGARRGKQQGLTNLDVVRFQLV
mmetsp:Transcript_23354/g.40194  ORF Transcript_23354/g.40194 Transcript_23354/m.40194 type:complete len:224 (-) Transcript_23354:290-961(-)